MEEMNKKYVVVDIDGTIAKVGDRLKYLKQKPKDWDKFYDACDEDEPIKDVIHLVLMLSKYYHIVFCTGRRESVWEKTVNWLSEHVYGMDMGYYNDKLLMRKEGDKRHDTVIKPELLEEADIELKDIAYVIEDRNSMVAKWRELGLTCLQPVDGIFKFKFYVR